MKILCFCARSRELRYYITKEALTVGYPTKVQQIKRKHGTDQWFISFPTPIAEAIDLEKSEVVEWLKNFRV